MLFHLNFAAAALLAYASASTLTPPVLPLIVRNPYLSTWLPGAREEPWKMWPRFWQGGDVCSLLYSSKAWLTSSNTCSSASVFWLGSQILTKFILCWEDHRTSWMSRTARMSVAQLPPTSLTANGGIYSTASASTNLAIRAQPTTLPLQTSHTPSPRLRVPSTHLWKSFSPFYPLLRQHPLPVSPFLPPTSPSTYTVLLT